MKRPRRLWRTSVDREVESELAFHLEMTTRELMDRGMTREAARAEAERRFGDKTAIDAECRRYGSERDRRERRAEYLGELAQDVSFALRQLLKAKGFTVVAVITLALGIGATATMFSVLDAVILRRLPFRDADRIVTIHPTIDGRDNFVSPPELLGFRDVRAFEFVAAHRPNGGVAIQLGDVPEMVDAETVTADYFAVLGVRPALGRTFTAAEDAAGGPNVAMLSHRFWVGHFNGDPAVIDRVVQIDGKPHTIVGVMPSSFDYVKSSPNIWLPLALGAEDVTRFGAHYLAALGRLRPGTTVQQARAASEASERAVASRMSTRARPLSSYGADVRRLSDDLVRNYRALLFILLGAVGLVLLIACGNVANLLLARGTTRAREFAIRAALGAGRGRLVRQLLAESLTLALVGAIAGLGVAVALLRTLRLVSPDNIPRLEQAAIDWRVLAFTLAIGVTSSILFGLAPALRAVRPHLHQTLREGGRGSSAARDTIRPLLVGAQVALTLVLLVGAALLIRSAWLIQHVDPGFEPRGILTARVLLPGERYPSGESIVRAFKAMREEATRIPGVESVALCSVVPLSGSRTVSSISAEDRPRGEQEVDANLRMVSDGYLRTMRIPLIAGRDVARTDGAETTPVVVVNLALVRTLWPGIDPRDAIGRHIRAVPTRRTDLENWEVVGVAGDLHDAALTERPVPEMYAPFAQTTDTFWPYLGRSLVIVLRQPTLDASSERLTRQLQRAITRVDASLPLADAKSMEEYLAGTLATARMNTLLLSTLGGIALVLAIVGIYGVVSYFVSQRTQEIGIRVALGSSPLAIWRLVVERGMRPVVVGIGVGVALSLVTSTLLRSQLFGVAARDPVTILAVGVMLVVVAVVAMYVPARRAMRVSPIVALTSS